VEAHGDDLRAEVAKEERQPADGDALVAAVKADYRKAPLAPADRRMLDFAVKLTATPHAMTREDVESLRTAGFSDAAIHDVVQVTGLFACYNRLADGLGIELEPGWASPP
jgi:uncharacterized peroxidase-related enzyme